MTSMTPVYDAHVHLFSADRARFPQVPGRERPLEHDGSVETLVRLLDESGVRAALLVQTPWLGEDNRYLVEAMRRYPGRFAAIGWLEDPLAPDAPDRLERQYEAEGFRGVRLHLVDEPVHRGLLDGGVDHLLRWARRRAAPVQLLNRIPHHPAIAALAGRFPDVRLVVDHLGYPEGAEAPAFESSASLLALAAHPNVFVKVSMHSAFSRAPYPWADLHDFQRRLFDAFGPRRLMWGSNWPMRWPEQSYPERLDAVRRHLPALAALPPEDQAWVLGGTAQSLWPVTTEAS